ncbi:putative methylesterase 12, chloroplastic [Chenopodium quinoa]|uniref:AB hydrolase-1 domain-containing protein n=1 Tax=Chenopodium quinoa TaxID=63459 RepID=A0A803M2B5_CHEQI|nr:putative methylesterase 12, chloroplastic [Chenopodium quinoa]
MGNRFICMSKKDTKINGSKSRRMGSKSQRKLLEDEEVALHRRALSMALHQHQLSQRFDPGSMSSRRVGGATSRRRTLSDPFSNSKQAPDFLENLKGTRFVLVHGEGFGAWCWYKTIALLEESGLLPVALDLSGSGIDTKDANSIATLVEYSKPLITYIENLLDDEKVILVGHGCGGASVSYAMEQFPQKISKAIFVCATMVSSGQKPFDVFSEELGPSEDFMKDSKFLIHGNGTDNPPTSFMLERQHLKALYFNQSPLKDFALAMVSMRPIPLGPIMEKLSLSPEKYGTVRRFFIQTLEDRALSPDVQEKLVRENPPEGVYKIKGSDHCPFFSKPQSLHKMLLEIAQIA